MKQLLQIDRQRPAVVCPFCRGDIDSELEARTHWDDRGGYGPCDDTLVGRVTSVNLRQWWDGEPARVALARDPDGDLWLIVSPKVAYPYPELVPTSWSDVHDLLEMAVAEEWAIIEAAQQRIDYWRLQQTRARELEQYFEDQA